MSVQEARVHAALVGRPKLKGLTAIEAHSGLGRMTLMGDPRRGTPGVLPAEGASSGLLYCETRGVFTIDAEERVSMVIEVLPYGSANSSSADHQELSIEVPTTPSKSVEGVDDLEGKEMEESNGPQMTSSEEAPWIDTYADLLHPGNDLWRNVQTPGEKALGDAGWTIAMVWGFQPAQVPLKAIQAVLGKSAQQTQRTMDKLGFERTKGRNALVSVDLSLYVFEDFVEEGCFVKGLRAGQKIVRAYRRKQQVGRRGTRHGFAAYRICQHREQVAEAIEDRTWHRRVQSLSEDDLANALSVYVTEHGDLPEWALAVFGALRAWKGRLDMAASYSDAIAEAETEEHKAALGQLKAHLVDSTAGDYVGWWLEPVEVPDTPEEVVEAQPAPKDSVSAEKLAAMRWRITQGSPASRPEPKPAREAGPLDPETAERWRRCRQDRRLYETVYGTLPAELRA
ncbi:hypothetical protein [Streptomyces brasiliscabiei]|uniref:hypothetical protein n=1 Tax=Streptomyces brasiliscabiei TaxID=2736302 RepID=UPI001C121A7F|nr:hypothetical protein [Streptomyces brasiliscabiei]